MILVGAQIGPPNPNLADAMEREHCHMPDSTLFFRTTNYGIDTRSDIEYAAPLSSSVPAHACVTKWAILPV